MFSGGIRLNLLNDCPWTIAVTLCLLVANLGLVDGVPTALTSLPDSLEYDRQAIVAGQLWRLVTGHLVHWSVPHAALDLAAFFVVGVLYEKRLRTNLSRHALVAKLAYPSLLATSAVVVGAAIFMLRDDLATYRGFSGLNSAQFAAVLVGEWRSWRSKSLRLVTVGMATAVFVTKIVTECVTGAMFFGTEALGDLGQPVPLAHATGALFGMAWMLAVYHSTSQRSGLCATDDVPVGRSVPSRPTIGYLSQL